MPTPGVSFDMNFAQEMTRAAAAMQATTEQVAKAAQRAIKKTMRWLISRLARELGQALGVAQNVIKPRLSSKAIGKGSDQVHVLWLGVAPLAAEKAGRARQTKRGVSVAKRQYQGAFIKDVYGDGDAVWIRKSRASALGHDLPKWGRTKGGSGGDQLNRGRFPVMRVAIDMETIAAEIFRRYDRRAIARFGDVIDQELNYVVNHER